MATLKQKLVQLMTITMTGILGTAAAQCPYECSDDPFYYDPCRPDPACIEMYNMDYQFYADFIWWQIAGSGLEFARLGGMQTDPTLEVNERGCIISPKCHFEPGFRIGMMFNPCGSTWDIFGQYTYLYTNVSTEESVELGVAGLRPLIWTHAYGGSTDLTLTRGEWQTHFNVFDFGFRKTYCIDNCFDFHPHLGIKAAWQKFQYDVTYQEMESTSTTSQSVQRIHTDFNGVGLRGGFDAAWRFSSCFSIVGGTAFSTVYSEICNTREDTFTDDINLNTPNTDINVNLKEEACALIPVIELTFGIRYNEHICGCYDVFAFVGWENQVWMDLNRNIYIQNTTTGNNNIQFGPSGHVTYQGLTARFGIGF